MPATIGAASPMLRYGRRLRRPYDVERATMKVGNRLAAERTMIAALDVGCFAIREGHWHLDAPCLMPRGTCLPKSAMTKSRHIPLSATAGSPSDPRRRMLGISRGLECEAGIRAAALSIARRRDARGQGLRSTATPRPQQLAMCDAIRNALIRQRLEQMRGGYSKVRDATFDRPDCAARSLSMLPNASWGDGHARL